MDRVYDRPCPNGSGPCGFHPKENWAYIDAHCHLDCLWLDKQVKLSDVELPNAFKGMVSVHCYPESFNLCTMYEDRQDIRVAIGLHTKIADQLTSKVYDKIKIISKEPKTCAIGEN